MAGMEEQAKKDYWLGQVADAAIKLHPTGEIVVSSGHSPSGSYHIGTLREIMTASAITWAIRQKGRQARHIDFVDDFDIYRKVPGNVPAEFSQHLGKPLYKVPDPVGACHDTYADHFYGILLESLDEAGVEMDSIRSHEEYLAGRFANSIAATLEKLDQVKSIILEVSGREVSEGWVPVQLLSDNDLLNEWTYRGWDKSKQVINYVDKAGKEGEVSYADGRVKLDWRLDWPARWSVWGVGVEPFGRDHATKGGSYDTGKALAQEIFAGVIPYPVPYEFINSPGETKKMSKSTGNIMTPGEAMEIMPAEILRFFIAGPRPSKELIFDSGTGLYNLIDEYSALQQEIAQGGRPERYEAWAFAANADSGHQAKSVISSVSFKHLVNVFQTAFGDREAITQILARTGYEKAVADEADIIQSELKYVKNWLDKYAPDSVKFEVQQELPKVELSKEQKEFLAELIKSLEPAAIIDGQVMHQTIYAASLVAAIKPAEAFKTLYRLILDKDSGPKAGWFLASLNHEWLVKRLKLEA